MPNVRKSIHEFRNPGENDRGTTESRGSPCIGSNKRGEWWCIHNVRWSPAPRAPLATAPASLFLALRRFFHPCFPPRSPPSPRPAAAPPVGRGSRSPLSPPRHPSRTATHTLPTFLYKTALNAFIAPLRIDRINALECARHAVSLTRCEIPIPSPMRRF